MKIFLRNIKRLIFGIIILLISYLIIALLLSLLSTNPHELTCNKNFEIFTSTNGVHLDIIISSKYLSKELQNELEISESTKFVSFGWGDREFYLNTPEWSDLEIITGTKAILFNTKSALHVTNHYNKKDHWYEISICKTQLSSLLDYLNASFKKNEENNIIEIEGSGYSDNDKFYEANGYFNGIKTCNIWVNNGLKAANIKTSIWSPFDYGVLFHVNRNNN